jgi:GNAT superfamily N-acetyltransferase
LVVEALDAINAANPEHPLSLGTFSKKVLEDPNHLDEGSLVAILNGQVVGYCLAIGRQVPLENAPPDNDRGYITLFGVSSPFQRRGIGSALLAEAEAFHRRQGRQTIWISPYAPNYFTPGVDVRSQADGLEFLKRRGYAEAYRPLAMRLKLADLKVPEWVAQRRAGLEKAERPIKFWNSSKAPLPESLTAPLLEFAKRHFPGDWVRVIREALAATSRGSRDRGLAIATRSDASGLQVLGFAHFEAGRFGPIGVAPHERGQGLGYILMVDALEAQREQGHPLAWFMWTDDRTAERLYKPMGFQEARRFAVLKKSL